jgi:uncharacterized protein
VPGKDEKITESANDRVVFIDALRGFAMLGIVIVNFPSMNTLAGKENIAYGGVETQWDAIFEAVNMALFNAKVYPIFAFLFGLSMFFFFKSRQAKGEAFRFLTAKRLSILFGIGVLHIALVWWGDILVAYSFVGLLALLFVAWSPKKLLTLAIFLLLVVPFLPTTLDFADDVGLLNVERSIFPGLALRHASATQVADIYANGSFGDIFSQRIKDYIHDFSPFGEVSVTLRSFADYVVYYAQLLGLFLLGIWSGKTGMHVHVISRQDQTTKLLIMTAAIALVISAARHWSEDLESVLYFHHGNVFGLLYILVFALIFPHLRSSLTPIVAVGKMSLTAYLAHTIFAGFLLYSVGMGLYGTIGPALLFPVSIFFYAAMALICMLWMRRFLFGPMEWIWRSILYGRVQPMVKAQRQ